MRSEAQELATDHATRPAAARARRARARGRRARAHGDAVAALRRLGARAAALVSDPRRDASMPARWRGAREEIDRLTQRVAELRERQLEMLPADRPRTVGSNDCNRECARSDGSADERRELLTPKDVADALPDQHRRRCCERSGPGGCARAGSASSAAYRVSAEDYEAWIDGDRSSSRRRRAPAEPTPLRAVEPPTAGG